MPTIDQLEAAVVAADDDALPVSQSGSTRRVSRSQLLAGVQPSLALMPGLLGRSSPGLGPPQQLSIGDGLTLTNGTLSGRPHFTPATLPVTNAAGLSDLVPISQSGQDHAIAVGALLSTSGIDISQQAARAHVGVSRPLADWLVDSVTAEAFGAVGDGTTDDSAALSAAIASGQPVRLGAKTYRVDGQWTIQRSAVLIGVAGSTTLRRSSQVGGAWISVSGANFYALDIIFDAGVTSVDSWGVLLNSTCMKSTIERCSFINALGPTLGCGLTVEARDGLAGDGSSHVITECVFSQNRCHGLWVQASSGADVRGCVATNNGGYGICLDFNDPSFQHIVRQARIVGCRCVTNSRGISVGNYNETNQEPPTWGLRNPDATDVLVSQNVCTANAQYGIAVSGARIRVSSNTLIADGGGSGILCNASNSIIDGNTISGSGEFGVDAGGSTDLSITSNTISGFGVGLNAGGSVRVQISRNRLSSNQRTITVFQVETDGHGSNFGLACSDVWIEDNLIQVDAGGGGVYLFDGPERVSIERNRFLTATDSDNDQLLLAYTNNVMLCQNTVNGVTSGLAQTDFVGAHSRLLVSDILDQADIPSGLSRVDSVAGTQQALMTGKISFISILSGGTGYSVALVVISGSGSGAKASAYIRNGAVIGIAMIANGDGYDTEAIVTIEGDGQGAAAKAYVGIPVSEGRRLTIQCPTDTIFPNSMPYLTNWTGADIIIPAMSSVQLIGMTQGWRVAQFYNICQLQPHADGSVSLQSSAGDLTLRPASGTGLTVQSKSEPLGFRTCFGRGSPEGVIAAPPGSDYRNLDGGSGSTLWIKRNGLSASGWFPVA